MTDIELIDYLIDHSDFQCNVVVSPSEIIVGFQKSFPSSDLFIELVGLGKKFYLSDGNRIVFKREDE